MNCGNCGGEVDKTVYISKTNCNLSFCSFLCADKFTIKSLQTLLKEVLTQNEEMAKALESYECLACNDSVEFIKGLQCANLVSCQALKANNQFLEERKDGIERLNV